LGRGVVRRGGGAMGAKPPWISEIFGFYGVFLPLKKTLSPPWRNF